MNETAAPSIRSKILRSLDYGIKFHVSINARRERGRVSRTKKSSLIRPLCVLSRRGFPGWHPARQEATASRSSLLCRIDNRSLSKEPPNTCDLGSCLPVNTRSHPFVVVSNGGEIEVVARENANRCRGHLVQLRKFNYL